MLLLFVRTWSTGVIKLTRIGRGDYGFLYTKRALRWIGIRDSGGCSESEVLCAKTLFEFGKA